MAWRLMQGNEAVAEGALAAGVRFFAGYPITPSTEIAEILAKKLPRVGGKFIQMEDEIASLAAVIGASLAGVKAMTATSGPGFSLMQENIGFAAAAEVPCVIVNVQRVGPSTGVPTAPAQGDVMQSRWGTHGDHPIIVLAPAFVKEAYEMTVRAVYLAEQYLTPVIILLDEVVGHMRERMSLDSVDISLPEEPKPRRIVGAGYRYHVTGLVHLEDGFPTTEPPKVEEFVRGLHSKIVEEEKIVIADLENIEDADILVIAYGAVARSALRAIREARMHGIKAGLLKLGTLWPFPERLVKELISGCRGVVVPEMNLGQIRLEIERVTRGDVPVLGVNKVSGELIRPEEILNSIRSLYSTLKKPNRTKPVRGEVVA